MDNKGEKGEGPPTISARSPCKVSKGKEEGDTERIPAPTARIEQEGEGRGAPDQQRPTTACVQQEER